MILSTVIVVLATCAVQSVVSQSGFSPGAGASFTSGQFPVQNDIGSTTNNGYYGGYGGTGGGYYGITGGNGYGTNVYNSPYTGGTGFSSYGYGNYNSGSSSNVRVCAFGACFDPTVTNMQGTLPFYNSGTTCSNGVCYSSGTGNYCNNGNCYSTGTAGSTTCLNGSCYTSG